MNTTPNKRQDDKSSMAEAMTFLIIVLAIFGYIKRNAIFYIYETNCEKLFFALWLLALYFIFKRLKANFEHGKEDRKTLLKMKSLRTKTGPIGLAGGVKRMLLTERAAVPDEIKIGTRLKDGRPIYLSDNKRTTHVQVLGATGRGKTESVILPWMVQDFNHGKSVILIDGKGDPELARRFKRYCQDHNNESSIYVFDPMDKNSCTINPLQWGTPLQITDRIMSSFEFPDPYYKAIQSEGVLTVVNLLHHDDGLVTFRRLDQAFRDVEYLSGLAERCSKPEIKLKVRALLNLKESDRMSNFSGLLSQIAPFVTGEISDLVNGTDGEKRELYLSRVLTEDFYPKASLLLIPTLIYPEVGRVLGRMFLQEIAFGVGFRSSAASNERMASVFLDEFSSFAYAGFEQILNKARSAKVALHLSHQSTGDLETVSPEFAKIVNTNTNIKCLLGLNDPDTADFFARHMGTQTSTKFTERVEEKSSLFGSKDERTGSKSFRETEAYKIHPNRLKNLTAGEGVIHVPGRPDALTEEIQFFDLEALQVKPKNKYEVA